jgi:Ser/Thr protein kinase RdoA (MazF antagonist)
MASELEYAAVLAEYSADCQPSRAEPLGSAGGFSGAQFWRLTTPSGTLCLRRWPANYPPVDQLQFIQAVLWHVQHEGFDRVPLPLETLTHAGYVAHAGHFWELAPWLPGAANYHAHPTDVRLEAALRALAEFHIAAASFPLPDIGPSVSPGMARRRQRFEHLRAGGLRELSDSVREGTWPALAPRARQLLHHFGVTADRHAQAIERASRLRVALQPCIRDIWHDHVLFVGERVSGLVDFGGLRPDNPATDIARLIGSLAADDQDAWEIGLAAYETVRPLSEEELALIAVFDQTTVLMGGLEWLEWIYLQRKAFADRAAVESRLDLAIKRLARLADRR